jgi:predicted DNA-binding transcriptional regulator AlpA
MGDALQVYERIIVPGLGVPLEVVGGQVTSWDDFERSLETRNFPELVGVSELAELLGVSRQRASELANSKTFPKPVAQLSSGPVWVEAAVRRYENEWPRRPGRPPVHRGRFRGRIFISVPGKEDRVRSLLAELLRLGDAHQDGQILELSIPVEAPRPELLRTAGVEEVSHALDRAGLVWGTDYRWQATEAEEEPSRA